MTNQLSPEAVAFVNQLMSALSPRSPWVKERVKMVFANPSHTEGKWSTHNESGKFIDCESDMLRGRIAQLWHKREENGKTSWFLKLKCEDGYSYIIHSRHDRVFSKSMLGGLALMTEEELQSEITVQCAPWKAEEGYLQFCNIYIGERMIEVPRIDSNSLPEIAITAQQNVAAACGYEYIPPEQRSQDTSPSEPVAKAPPKLAGEQAASPDYDDIPPF